MVISIRISTRVQMCANISQDVSSDRYPTAAQSIVPKEGKKTHQPRSLFSAKCLQPANELACKKKHISLSDTHFRFISICNLCLRLSAIICDYLRNSIPPTAIVVYMCVTDRLDPHTFKPKIECLLMNR